MDEGQVVREYPTQHPTPQAYYRKEEEVFRSRRISRRDSHVKYSIPDRYRVSSSIRVGRRRWFNKKGVTPPPPQPPGY